MRQKRLLMSLLSAVLMIAALFYVSPSQVFAASFQTVYIGDSRTVGMYNAVYNKPVMGDNINVTEGSEKWIAKNSMGLKFAQDNWNAIKSQVSKDTRIVLLMGVNDLNASGYQNLLQSMKETCDNVYFVSVNPVNESKGGSMATNSMITSFNNSLKSFCESNGITYIDTYNSIVDDVTRNSNATDTAGLHYNSSIYQQIYNRVSAVVGGTAAGSTPQSPGRNEEADEPVRDLAPGEDDAPNAYSPDVNEVKQMYQTHFGWDFNKAKIRNWTNPVNGTEEEFERQAGWQEEFLGDNIMTTKQYLGLDGKGGSKKPAASEEVVNAALGEVGKDDSVESPLGSDNVKYNTWYYGEEITDGAHPWDGVFVSWVMDQANLIETGFWEKIASVSEMYEYVTGTLGFSAYNSNATTPFGGNSYTPVPGDLMFFKTESGWSHVGIIVQVSSDGWYTVEGDVESKVQKLHYSADDPEAVENTVVIAMKYPASDYEGGTAEQNAQTIFDFCIQELGYNSAAAVGVVANAYAESGCMPDVSQVGGPAYGIFQWDDRKQSLYNWCEQNGYDCSTLEAQLWFMKYECDTTESAAHQKMLNVSNTAQGAYDAGYIWCVDWERPSEKYVRGVTRGNDARDKYWPLYGDG